MEEIFLTFKEMAKLFKLKSLTNNSVKKFIKSGAVPPAIKIGKRYLWNKTDVEKWLSDRGFKNVNLSKFMDGE